jgi:hypothetical protein
MKDILFYSNFCTYCKEIINTISKTPLNNSLMFVCVDDDNIQLPPFVTAVPTIYLVSEKKIVVDEGIESWIKEKLTRHEKPSSDVELQPYFGSCTSSFGNGFSSIDDSDNKPFISSFTFLGDEQAIETPDAENSGSGGFQTNSKSMGDYEKLQQERNNEFKPISRR